MSLHTDLIEQARHLARREPRRPKQVSLRRSVSAAYYALFHYLVDRACDLLVARTSRPHLHAYVARAFHHESMFRVCKGFASARPVQAMRTLIAGKPSPELTEVGWAFVELQQRRHDADYDRGRSFVRQDAIEAAELAERAMSAFEPVKRSSQAEAFLVALVVHKISRA